MNELYREIENATKGKKKKQIFRRVSGFSLKYRGYNFRECIPAIGIL